MSHIVHITGLEARLEGNRVVGLAACPRCGTEIEDRTIQTTPKQPPFIGAPQQCSGCGLRLQVEWTGLCGAEQPAWVPPNAVRLVSASPEARRQLAEAWAEVVDAVASGSISRGIKLSRAELLTVQDGIAVLRCPEDGAVQALVESCRTEISLRVRQQFESVREVRVICPNGEEPQRPAQPDAIKPEPIKVEADQPELQLETVEPEPAAVEPDSPVEPLVITPAEPEEPVAPSARWITIPDGRRFENPLVLEPNVLPPPEVHPKVVGHSPSSRRYTIAMWRRHRPDLIWPSSILLLAALREAAPKFLDNRDRALTAAEMDMALSLFGHPRGLILHPSRQQAA